MCSRTSSGSGAARLRLPLAAMLLATAASASAELDAAGGKPARPATPAPGAESPAPVQSGKSDKPSDKDKVVGRMRPNGPVTINADGIDWTKNGLMVYTGHVQLRSDTLNIDGDRLELEQLPDSQYRAKVNGTPALMVHQGSVNEQGQADPPVSARGKQINYDSQSGLADVIGNARVTRGDDEITGESMHYNVLERRIQAVGGNTGQVKIVLQPNRNGIATTPKPATPAPGAAAPTTAPPAPSPAPSAASTPATP